MSYTAKSVIFDIADTHGAVDMGIRQIDFYFEGSKLDRNAIFKGGDTAAGATSSFSINFHPVYVFHTVTVVSKTGSATTTSWLSADTSVPQRLICIFYDGTVTFDEIRINNYHDSGSDTDKGVKNVVITISDDEIMDTTYNASISNSTEIFDGQFDEHTGSDVEDEQVLLSSQDPTILPSFSINAHCGGSIEASIPSISPWNIVECVLFSLFAEAYCGGDIDVISTSFSMEASGGNLIETTLPFLSIDASGGTPIEITFPSLSVEAYGGGYLNEIIGGENVLIKSVIFDIADSWGSYCGIRAIDFYNDGSLIANEHITNFEAYTTDQASDALAAYRAFDTSLSKIGTSVDKCWMSTSSGSLRLICVFNVAKYFDEIRINNYHHSGDLVDRGAKNVIINISTEEITDITYNAVISNSTQIGNGQFDEHIEADEEDEQIFALSYTSELLKSPLSMTGTGGDWVFAFFGNLLPVFTIQASGTVSWETDDLEVELPFFEMSMKSGGSVQIALPIFQVKVDGNVGAVITADIEFPSINIEMITGGSLLSLTPQLNVISEGATGHSCEIICELPEFSLTVHNGGYASVSLPNLEMNAETIITVPALVSFNFPSLQFLGSASRASEGSIELSMPRMQADIVVTIGIVGTILNDLPLFSLNGNVLTGILGNIDGSLKGMWLTGSGQPVGPGIIEIEIPILKIMAESGKIPLDVLRYNRRRVA